MKEIQQCPLCDSQNFSPYLTCQDHTVSGEVFPLIRCNACGFVITSPRPEDVALPAYYQSEDYISHSGTKKGLINKLYHAVRNYSLLKKYHLVRDYAQANNSLIDYGCGTGEFLAQCQQKGMAVYGCEPDSKAREKAGSKIQSTALVSPPDYASLDVKVDVISMWHVLEHIPDFIEVLQLHKSKLNHNGTIILAVPNHNSYDARKYQDHWAAYDVPRHLWHFSSTDINRLAEKIKMKVAAVKPMLFDAFYVSMLSEQYKNGSLPAALFSGIKSNFAAHKTGFGYSSQIYILQNRF